MIVEPVKSTIVCGLNLEVNGRSQMPSLLHLNCRA